MSSLSFQRGYLAEPLSEEEQTKINTYLTICKNTFVILVSTYMKSCFQCSDMLVSLQKVMFVFYVANGGNVQNTWWIGGIDLHQEVI